MSKSNKDLYALMGVTATASDAEIRAAYRKLVLQFHPDSSRSTANVESFQDIRNAYQVLTDVGRRKAYDAERSERSWSAAPRKVADQRIERKLERKRATSGQLKVTARVLNAAETAGRRPLRQAPPQTNSHQSNPHQSNQVLEHETRNFSPPVDPASAKLRGFFARWFRRA